MKTIPGYESRTPGMQVATKLIGDITFGKGDKLVYNEEGIRLLQQLGVEWIMVNDVPEHSVKCYKHILEDMAGYGFKVYRIANRELHNMSSVTLNLPDRDQMIDRYLEYLRQLGEAGLHYATYAHMGNGIWRGDFRREIRGGATGTGLDLKQPMHNLAYGHFSLPLSHGREYTEDELWENYAYFIRRSCP